MRYRGGQTNTTRGPSGFRKKMRSMKKGKRERKKGREPINKTGEWARGNRFIKGIY